MIFFSSKVQKLRKEISYVTENNFTIFSIKNYMRGKNCYFEFSELGEETVKRLIKSVCKDKQPGIDNIDKLIRLAIDYVSGPIRHIFNMSLKQSIFPQAWKEAKIMPLTKDRNIQFSGSNSRPVSVLPVLGARDKGAV